MLSSLFLSQPLLILKTTHNSQESYPVTLFVSGFSFFKFSKVSTKHFEQGNCYWISESFNFTDLYRNSPCFQLVSFAFFVWVVVVICLSLKDDGVVSVEFFLASLQVGVESNIRMALPDAGVACKNRRVPRLLTKFFLPHLFSMRCSVLVFSASCIPLRQWYTKWKDLLHLFPTCLCWCCRLSSLICTHLCSVGMGTLSVLSLLLAHHTEDPWRWGLGLQRMKYMPFPLARSWTSVFETLSYHLMHKICSRHLRWNVLSFLSCLA